MCNLFSSCLLPTTFGMFRLDVHQVGKYTVPVIHKNLVPCAANVRVHDACFTSEVLHSEKCDCDQQLTLAMKLIEKDGGVILYAPNEGRGIGLGNKVKAYHIQDTLLLDTYEANRQLGFEDDERSYDFIPPILAHYGITSMHLLTNNKEKVQRIHDVVPDITILSLKPILVRPTRCNHRYLEAKASRSVAARPSQIVDIPRALREFGSGRPLIVVDDDDREREGDLIMRADMMTDEWMAFFVQHTSGLICCSLTQARADALRLPPMVTDNEDAHQTAFTVSVDHTSCTTGISARERAATCRSLVDAEAHEFRRPGHMMPLIAKESGVLERRGHTEAGVDLCRLVGAPPCAVLSEITSPDRLDMATLDDLQWFAYENDLSIVTIESLVAHLKTMCGQSQP